MSFADRREAIGTSLYWLHAWPRSYGFALAAVASATLIRHGLGVSIGFTPPFILLYPTILLIALLCGFGAALFATLLAMVLAGYLFLEPFNSIAVSNPRDIVGLAIFGIMGVALSGVGGLLRRYLRRVQEFEKAMDGLEEMIAVVDRDYRYVIANRSFLSYRGLKQEDLLGRRIPDVLNPGVFETTVKQKLDECFQGKVVEYEMRYDFPSRGERDLSVCYFPVEGPGGIDRAAIVLRDITDLKQAEGALHDSEDRYRDLVEHSEDLVCTHDLEGNLLSVNPAPARLLGYEVTELLKIPMRDLIAPDYRGMFDEYLARIKANGADKGLLCVMTRSGEPRIWEYNNTLRTDGVPTPIVRGMAHDITDKRRAELTSQASEHRYRQLFEENVAGVAISNLDGEVLDCNDAWARTLGYSSAKEVRGRQTSDFCLSISERKSLLEELTAKGTFVGREIQLKKKDGTPVWVLFNAAALHGDGAPVIQATAIDVTERRQAEQELRHSEERFRVALKDSPITVFNQDRDLRYTWIYNPQFHCREDIIGKTDNELLGPEAGARLTELKRRVMATGTLLREEVAITQGNKRSVFDLTIEPLLDADGNVIGITAAAVDIARLREMTDRLQEAKDKLVLEKSYLESEIQTEFGFEEIIGQSSVLRDVLKKARVVAPTDSTVLLLGETGTGKELVARAVHALSSRHSRNFIKLNCAAVPSGLLESELFGHEKGAFTGAVNQKVGRIELADKGTLFLDEIGELPLELQPKLLRVLQDREFERLGGVHTLHVDVRIISATNRDLRQDIADRKFREDLFYRLNVFPIQLPPLRERRSDIPMLVQHFVNKHATRMGKQVETIPDETMDVLQNWIWPGNIRELENMIERMVIMTKGSTLAEPPVELDVPQEVTDDNLTEMEREHIVRILRETNGVLSGPDGAANRLGIKRTTLQSMLKRFGIEPRGYRRATGTYGSE
jgi:formate hydrogenlyase transcriptional activator